MTTNITTWMHKSPPNNIGTLRYRIVEDITEIEYQLPVRHGEERKLPDFMEVFEDKGPYKIVDFKADVKWVGIAFEQVLDQHVFCIKLKCVFESVDKAKDIINSI